MTVVTSDAPGFAQATAKTVIITRPAAQAELLARCVAQAGFAPLIFPAIEIEPVEDEAPLHAALGRLAHYRLAIFVSPNAIDQAFLHLRRYSTHGWPESVPVAVMGPGSLRALTANGVATGTHRIFFPCSAENAGESGEPEFPPSMPSSTADRQQFDSESLFEQLDIEALRGGRVLIVKGNGGRPWLADRLTERGVLVDAVESYRRKRHVPDADERTAIRALLDARAEPIWLVTSSEAIGYLIESLREIGGEAAVAWLKTARWVVPHRRIGENATAAGITDVVLSGSGDRAIVQALE